MKKIILILALLVSPVFACDSLNCSKPYDMTSKTSQFFSKVTGQNFLAEQIAGKLIKKAVKKNIESGNIKASLKSFSVRDLKAGRFKTIEISGKDVNVQGIYITYFKAKTLCDFNYIVEDKNKDLIIKEDIPMAVSAVITEDDLNKTMNSSDYKRLVGDINNLIGSFNIFQINSTSVKLKNNKMYYIMKYSLPFARKSKQAVLSADICVENGKLKMKNTELINCNIDVNAVSKILNYINPLDFSVKILENKDAKFNIQNVTIADGKINMDGKITILKDKE